MAETKQSFMLEDVKVSIDGNIVGGVQSLEVSFAQENKPLGEAGTKKKREIMSGAINITGSVERLFLEPSLITDHVDTEAGDNPYFTLTGTTVNKTPQRKISIIDAKFKGFSLSMALGEETKVPQEFDALDIKIY